MTAKKDVFNIKSQPIGWYVNIQNELNNYYAQQKQEYIRKYGLKELKQGQIRTALEEWQH
mgnify:CR=1 FL=1